MGSRDGDLEEMKLTLVPLGCQAPQMPPLDTACLEGGEGVVETAEAWTLSTPRHAFTCQLLCGTVANWGRGQGGHSWSCPSVLEVPTNSTSTCSSRFVSSPGFHCKIGRAHV